MSGVNITILEGGKAENFGQVTKLRTSNGTDHDLWVPKTDVETKHLSVKKNGLYYSNQYTPTSAEKKDKKSHGYDVYGFDTITVNIKKKVTGKVRKHDPITGEDYDATVGVEVDEEHDDTLVETELPDSIEVETPPTKVEYYDGENINISGIVVKAYYHNGDEWGIVPVGELRIDPTKAEYDSGAEEWSDGSGVVAIKAPVAVVGGAQVIDMPLWSGSTEYGGLWRTRGAVGNWSGIFLLLTNYNGGLFAAVNENGVVGLQDVYEYLPDGRMVMVAGTSINRLGTAFSFVGGEAYGVPTSLRNPEGVDINTMHPTDQNITVMWNRPVDEEELTDSFNISIIPHN